MVSGTGCPAWTDLPWLWSGSRAAAPKHYGLWIGLGGSLSILVKIFISVILLKLYRIVKVTYEHTLPAHTADF